MGILTAADQLPVLTPSAKFDENRLRIATAGGRTVDARMSAFTLDYTHTHSHMPHDLSVTTCGENNKRAADNIEDRSIQSANTNRSTAVSHAKYVSEEMIMIIKHDDSMRRLDMTVITLRTAFNTWRKRVGT